MNWDCGEKSLRFGSDLTRCFIFPAFSGRGRPLYTSQVEDDVFPHAADGEDARVLYSSGDLLGRGILGAQASRQARWIR